MSIKKKNLLILSNYSQMYGAEVSMFETMKVLHHCTITVVLAQPGEFQTLLKAQGIRVIIQPFFQLGEATITPQLARLEKIVEQYSIDIIHLNKCHPDDFEFIKAIRTMSSDRSIVMTVHIRGRYDYTFEQRAVLATMDKMISVSQQMKDELLRLPCPQELAHSNGLIKVIHNGRALSQYTFSAMKRDDYRQRYKIANDELVIGLFGYFKPLKGQDRLVQLACQFKQSANIRFLLIGDLIENHRDYDANRDYYQNIIRSIKEHQLEEKVILTGYIEASEILSALDIVVSLSDHEGLPGVIMEAMAAERCVIANGVGGIPEMINDQTGFCIEPNQLDEMARLIDHLDHHRDQLRMIGKKSRQRAEALFDIQKHGQQIETLFDELLGPLAIDLPENSSHNRAEVAPVPHR